MDRGEKARPLDRPGRWAWRRNRWKPFAEAGEFWSAITILVITIYVAEAGEFWSAITTQAQSMYMSGIGSMADECCDAEQFRTVHETTINDYRNRLFAQPFMHAMQSGPPVLFVPDVGIADGMPTARVSTCRYSKSPPRREVSNSARRAPKARAYTRSCHVSVHTELGIDNYQSSIISCCNRLFSQPTACTPTLSRPPRACARTHVCAGGSAMKPVEICHN